MMYLYLKILLKLKNESSKNLNLKKSRTRDTESSTPSTTSSPVQPVKRDTSHLVWGSDVSGKVYKFMYSCDVNGNNCNTNDISGNNTIQTITTPNNVPLKKVYHGKSNIWGLSGSHGSAVYQCSKDCTGNWTIR